MYRFILILVLCSASRSLAEHAPLPTGRDLDGQIVAPLNPSADTQAVVLFFTAPDCPISNRYAPAMRRLAQEFGEQNIKTWLVYADDLADADTIRKHRTDFDLDLPVAIDRSFEIADYVQAEVTPEAVVIVFSGELRSPTMVYRGRIDDKYQGFGKYRPVATQHELRDLLGQVAAGDTPAFTTTKAIGCYIPRPVAGE